jgi:beta-glucosidase
VWRGQTGKRACDHYHRYAEDITLMQKIGLSAYRLSIAWPRILPRGTGETNAPGLDFYDRLIDALLDANVTPWVTLFHWDYPLELYRRGGWLNRESPSWFASYADLVAERLGDRVKHWITINEPQVFVDAGLREGRHAPGDCLALSEVLLAAHHVLLAHGLAVQALRSRVPNVNIGFSPVALTSTPATSSAADRAAAKQWMFGTRKRTLRTNAWWMDTALFGEYPSDGVELFGNAMPEIGPRDLATIHQPLDFFGANIYDAECVRADETGAPVPVPPAPGAPASAFDWPITPEALYFGPKLLHERYGLPVVITENGLSTRDWVSLDGAVHDSGRVDFLNRHLVELARAVSEGVPVDGYFHWSILDNFEWAHGYKHRFGLVHVDFETQKRTLKDSAHRYSEIIASNGASLFS